MIPRLLSMSLGRAAQPFSNSPAQRLTRIHSLLDRGAYQPALVARVLESVMYTSGNKYDIAGIEFHRFAVEKHRATARQHVKHLMLVIMDMHRQFLSGQEAQQTAAQVFLNEQRHVGQRLFVVARYLWCMKDLRARRHDLAPHFLRRAEKIKLPRKIKIASTLNSPAHIRSGWFSVRSAKTRTTSEACSSTSGM